MDATNKKMFKFVREPLLKALTLHIKLVSLRYTIPLHCVEPNVDARVASYVPKFAPVTVILTPPTMELAGGVRESMEGA